MIAYGAKRLSRVREKRNLDSDKINWFLPHSSSDFFREPTYERVAKSGVPIPSEK